MYGVNEKVIYGSQGICEIIEIVKRNVGGKDVEYYVLTPYFNRNTTFFVPLENKELVSRIYEVFTKKQAEEFLGGAKEYTVKWLDDDDERRAFFRGVISSGNRPETVGVIKALYVEKARRKKEGKKLHQFDENLLNLAQRVLSTELAYVFGVTPEDAREMLGNAL